MEPISNNWAQIGYHLGTAHEESRRYDLDDYNDLLLHSTQMYDNFMTSRQKEKVDSQIRETMQEFLKEIQDRDERARRIIRTSWNEGTQYE